MYAIPTSKQRRQARMRKRASRDALQVEIRFIPKMTADASEIVNTEGVLREMKIECAAYQLAFNKPLLNVPHVLLLKSPENRLNSMIKMFDGWGVRKETEFRYLKKGLPFSIFFKISYLISMRMCWLLSFRLRGLAFCGEKKMIRKLSILS